MIAVLGRSRKSWIIKTFGVEKLWNFQSAGSLRDVRHVMEGANGASAEGG